MSSLAASDLGFLRALSELAYCNPFSPRRLELEREALGSAYQEEEHFAWSRSLATGGADRPNVRRLTVLAASVAERLQPKEEFDSMAGGELAQLYHDLVRYVLYYRHIASQPLTTLMPHQRGAKSSAWRAFRTDYERFFPFRETPSEEVAHEFACLCQVRRAFRHIFDCILGESRPAVQLREQVWQSIFTHDMRRYRRALYGRMAELSTLIVGPSGTGKELVARAIALSQYVAFDPHREVFVDDLQNAFTPINLSALSPTLIESELFGHHRGAFTGATGDRVGWLESCPASGAVFLDEIGELDMAIQVKLLRVVQNRTYSRLGESIERPFAGKILAATNRNLADEMKAGRFRHDLYYRLCSDSIQTPSLAEQVADRPEALGGLIRFLAWRVAGDEGVLLAEEVERWVANHLGENYPWPGNIRELEQCVRNVLVRNEYRPASQELRTAADATPLWLLQAKQGELTAEELAGAYCSWMYQQLGSYEQVAKRLGLDRRTVRSKILAWEA